MVPRAYCFQLPGRLVPFSSRSSQVHAVWLAKQMSCRLASSRRHRHGPCDEQKNSYSMIAFILSARRRVRYYSTISKHFAAITVKMLGGLGSRAAHEHHEMLAALCCTWKASLEGCGSFASRSAMEETGVVHWLLRFASTLTYKATTSTRSCEYGYVIVSLDQGTNIL